MSKKELKLKMRETPEGRLLLKAGLEPYSTESSARRVAEFAVKEIAKLRSQIIEDSQQKDKQRIDWIESMKGQCGYGESLYNGEGFFAHGQSQGDKYFAGKTLREAIDKARFADIKSRLTIVKENEK